MYDSCWECRDKKAKTEFNRNKVMKAYYKQKEEERRAAELAKRLEEEESRRKEEYRRKHLCLYCGGPLRYIYKAYGVCGKCRRYEDEASKSRKEKPEPMQSKCYDCMFAKYIGGNRYSCMSAYGTGPDTQDCLRYTAGRTLRIKIIVEEENE